MECSPSELEASGPNSQAEMLGSLMVLANELLAAPSGEKNSFENSQNTSEDARDLAGEAMEIQKTTSTAGERREEVMGSMDIHDTEFEPRYRTRASTKNERSRELSDSNDMRIENSEKNENGGNNVSAKSIDSQIPKVDDENAKKMHEMRVELRNRAKGKLVSVNAAIAVFEEVLEKKKNGDEKQL